MNKLLSSCLLAAALCGAGSADTILSEGFEGAFPPARWTTNSVEQATTYTHTGTYSARLNAADDYLITPPLTNAQVLTFWSYTTSADPDIIVETSTDLSNWTAVTESPFSGDTDGWNERTVLLLSSGTVYVKFQKNGTGSLYIDDVSVNNELTVNVAPALEEIGSKTVIVGDELSFAVTATDANTDDDIVLSAATLPTGAFFNTVTNSGGSVSNTFIWPAAAPTGTYSVTFFADDGITNVSKTINITVTPSPPTWTIYYNLPYQSSSGNLYPDQFIIRNALVDRINDLKSGDSAILATFTFSAAEGAGAILTAMDSALDRGAIISFIADADINVADDYGADHSLFDMVFRPVNRLTLQIDNSSSGIMHDKLGLFDYGGTNQWVFTASWNFTEGASANQWNIALEARSPSLYSVYTNETAELLAGRFHDDPAKSHAHDGSTFLLDGSWGTNFARFSPPPNDYSVEDDITNLISQAQSEIVFALNKLTRTPIRDALVAAADRGVIIKGVMPRSDTEGDSAAIYSYLTNSANYATTNTVKMLTAYAEADYSALDSGEQDLVHTKYMVIDPNSFHAVVIHGSANWTGTALVNNNDNDENTLFLRHNGIAAEFYENFQRITGTESYSAGDATLVSWDFSDTNRIADGGITANLSCTIARDASQTNYTYTSEALSANGWDDGVGTKYWETQFTTTNYADIKVSSRQLASSTGPADFKLQYKTSAGETYDDIPSGTVHVPDGGNGLLTRVPLPEACNNQATIFLRWLLTSDTSASGGTIGSTGVGRIDDIVVIGTTYEQPPPVTIDPPILILTIEGSQPTIYWDATNGLRYTVLWTPSLLEEFQPLTTNNWPTDNWTDTAHTTNTTGFYKLDVEEIE